MQQTVSDFLLQNMHLLGAVSTPYVAKIQQPSSSKPSDVFSGKPIPVLPLSQNDAALEAAKPSIDGPPSSERIREYTEQMKMNYISTASSLRSRGSSMSGESSRLSRTSSQKSNSARMHSRSRGERPESVYTFGKKIFARKKSREEPGHSRASSSLSIMGDASLAPEPYETIGKHSATSSLAGSTSSLEMSRKRAISGPYNFQHVTHTQHDHLPDLARASRSDLVSEFSAIRASQAPLHGQLKGIRARDLPKDNDVENYSYEYMNAAKTNAYDPSPYPRPDSQNKPQITPEHRRLAHAVSHDMLSSRGPPPPRPPRSPVDERNRVPPRTSSRAGSMLWDQLSPVNSHFDRPLTSASFRNPNAFHLPISPPQPIIRSEELDDYFVYNPIRSNPRTPENEQWPLPSPGDSAQLEDVPEEDENHATNRRSRISRLSLDKRMSRSVPDFKYHPNGISENTASHEEHLTENDPNIGFAISPTTTTTTTQPAELADVSWEDDIDYCYEHEAEADFDYEWTRSSLDQESRPEHIIRGHSQPLTTEPAQQGLPSRQSNVPSLPYSHTHSTSDVNDLSPISPTSIFTPELRDSSDLIRSRRPRSPSQRSEFKESQGFNLSPSLLIPNDFATQMSSYHNNDNDELYCHPPPFLQALNSEGPDVVHISPNAYDNDRQHDAYPTSPVDTRSSTTSSFRSSGFSNGPSASRASNGSASLLTTGSQESVALLSRAANVALAHRSMSSSTTSLPELVHSKPAIRERESPRTPEVLLEKMPSVVLSLTNSPGAGYNEDVVPLSPTAGTRWRSAMPKKVEQLPHRKRVDGVDYPRLESLKISATATVTPLAHKRERSAPLLSSPRRENERSAATTTTTTASGSPNRRMRASSVAQGAARMPARGSYMLFPQT